MKKPIFFIFIFIDLISTNQITPMKIHPQSFRASIEILLTREADNFFSMQRYAQAIKESRMNPTDYLISLIRRLNKGKIPINKPQTEIELTAFIIRTFSSITAYSTDPIEAIIPDLKIMADILVDEVQILPRSLKKLCQNLEKKCKTDITTIFIDFIESKIDPILFLEDTSTDPFLEETVCGALFSLPQTTLQ